MRIKLWPMGEIFPRAKGVGKVGKFILLIYGTNTSKTIKSRILYYLFRK